jgi:hypothetical protein
MITLSANEVTHLMMKEGIPQWAIHLADASYVALEREWFYKELYPSLERKLREWGLDDWQRSWDCDDFARELARWAQISHQMASGAGAEGAGVWEFWFAQDPPNRQMHAIDVALLRLGDSASLHFVEPQPNARLRSVSLSTAQRASCVLVR